MKKKIMTTLAVLAFKGGFAMDINRKRPAEQMTYDHTYLNVFNAALIVQASRNVQQNTHKDDAQKMSTHPLSLRFMMNNVTDTGKSQAQPIANFSHDNNNNNRLQSLNTVRFHCTHQGCDNNGGQGFSQKQSVKRHTESIHNNVRHNCTHQGCDNNGGLGFSQKQSLITHIKSAHNNVRHNCTHQGCDNNGGLGFSQKQSLQSHIENYHDDTE